MYKYPVQGDIVYLKSGGLEMVVSDVQGGFASCVWHDMRGTAQSASYRLTLLSFDRPVRSTPAVRRKKATASLPAMSLAAG
jgi:uncharacterized protein YodC (DUF2158 family)